jgi:hypothetical protein
MSGTAFTFRVEENANQDAVTAKSLYKARDCRMSVPFGSLSLFSVSMVTTHDPRTAAEYTRDCSASHTHSGPELPSG